MWPRRVNDDVPVQESDTDVENTLDDLEKHLREKALRSMRKAQMSPSQMS